MTRDYITLRAEVVLLAVELAPEPPAAAATDLVTLAGAGFVDQLGYHSVALVELGVAVEERFGLDPIGAEDVSGVETPDDLARFVAGRLGITVTAGNPALNGGRRTA